MKASAQWLPDRNYQEGPGIRVGELELHPGVAVRAGYNNNVFRSDGNASTGGRPKQSAAVLAVTPHLYLTTETAQRAKQGEDRPTAALPFLTFRAGLAATYLQYFIENGPHNVAADADVFLGIAQGRPVGVDVSLGYMRSVAPFTENARDNNAYNYHLFDPKLRLKFSSRSRVLTGYLGYAPRLTRYESSIFDYLNDIQHGAEAGAAWRFLPTTALVYDATYALQNYLNRTPEDQYITVYSNNQIFRTRLGLNGAITNRLALRVLAGYGVAFIKDSRLDDREDVIGEAVLSYAFGLHGVEAGYQRDVYTSPLGAWQQIDRGFGGLTLMFAQVFRLRFEAGVGRANYGALLRTLSTGEADTDGVDDGVTGMGIDNDRTRKDLRLDGAVRAEYRVTNWLAFMADFTVQSVITDFDYAAYNPNPDPDDPNPNQLIPDPADYTMLQVFGGVRFSY